MLQLQLTAAYLWPSSFNKQNCSFLIGDFFFPYHASVFVYQAAVCFVSQYTGVCHKRGKQQCLPHQMPGTWSAALLVLGTCTGRFPGEVLVIRTSPETSPGAQPHYSKYFWGTATSSDIPKLCTGGIWKLNSKKPKQCYKSLGMPTKCSLEKDSTIHAGAKENALIDITKNNWSSLLLFFNPCFYQRSFISHTFQSITHYIIQASREIKELIKAD